jgi:hypothetical protein
MSLQPVLSVRIAGVHWRLAARDLPIISAAAIAGLNERLRSIGGRVGIRGLAALIATLTSLRRRRDRAV